MPSIIISYRNYRFIFRKHFEKYWTNHKKGWFCLCQNIPSALISPIHSGPERSPVTLLIIGPEFEFYIILIILNYYINCIIHVLNVLILFCFFDNKIIIIIMNADFAKNKIDPWEYNSKIIARFYCGLSQ